MSNTETFRIPEELIPTNTKTVFRAGAKTRTIVAPSIMRRENIQCLIFPKVDVRIGQAPPGTWYKNDGDVVIVCPQCGIRHAIDVGPGAYKVDARGLVYPTILCPNLACTFDRYALLQGWSGMGRFGRKKDNARGIILYCMAWRKWMNGPAGWGHYLQPFEYCDAVSYESARLTWSLIIDKIKADKGIVVGIAPALDPHVSGDGDPRDSILSGKGI